MPLVALAGVNVHLAGRHVLRGIDWALRAGEHWAFAGHNGAGKSTLLRVIRGDLAIDDDGGTRRFALDGREEPAARAARRIGYVSPELHERYARLDLGLAARDVVASGFEDVLYLQRPPSDAEREAVDAVFARLGIEALANRPLRALSFGQVRVLLVARALVQRPRILILDEHASGLDRSTRGHLRALLDEVAATTPIVCASHRASDFPAAITDHATLRDGRLVDRGRGRPPAHRVAAPARDEREGSSTTGGISGREPIVAIRGAEVVRGGRSVLREIDFAIRPGEHTAIGGANGTGKSTFAALVAGTLPAVHGATIERFGAAGPFEVRELKRRIAHVSEELQIAYDARQSAGAVILSGFTSSIGLFEAVGEPERLRARALALRLGLAPLAGRRFAALSFGERRKVLVARALVTEPDLLILDEVWSGLDAGFRERLTALVIERVLAGTTLLAIAHHDDDIPSFVQRRYVIEDGRLRTKDR